MSPSSRTRPPELERAIVRLAALQTHFLMLLRLATDEAVGDEAHSQVVREVDRYWRAHSDDWNDVRYGCMRFFEALRGAQANVGMLRVLAALIRERRGIRVADDPPAVAAEASPELRAQLEDYFAVLDQEPFRERGDAIAAQAFFSEVDAVRWSFSFECPDQGRSLSDDDIGRALAAWRRTSGQPRRAAPRAKLDNLKWPFLAELCGRLFGVPLTAGTLEQDWAKWRNREDNEQR